MTLFDTSNSLYEDRDALETNYRSDLYIPREDLLKEYGDCLEPILEGSTPKDVVLQGEPGTGKTTTTNHVINELKSELPDSNQLHTASVVVSEESSSYQVLVELVNELRRDRGEESIPKTGNPRDGVLEKLLDELHQREGTLLLIIDDFHVVEDPDPLLRDLSRLDERITTDAVKIGVITITNDGSFLDELDSDTNSSYKPRIINFPSYSADEVEDILLKRAESAFEENALSIERLRLCVSLCLQQGGDLRYGLDLLLEAGDKAKNRIRETEDSTEREIIEEDIYSAEQRLSEYWFDRTLAGLPEQKQLVVFVLANYASTGETPCRTTTICDGFERTYDSISERQMRNYLDDLISASLLVRQEQSDQNGQYYTYDLACDDQTAIRALKSIELSHIDDATLEKMEKKLNTDR